MPNYLLDKFMNYLGTIRINELPFSATRLQFHQTLMKSEWQKAQSHQQIAASQAWQQEQISYENVL
jgi:hypothetical protein